MSMLVNPFVVAPAVPAFAPTDIADCVWWLRASSIGLSDGAAVEDWLDESGAGIHFGQATVARQPTYQTNVVNGHPVVRFHGDDYLVHDPTARTLAASNTLFCVCTPNTGTNDYLIGGNGGQGGPALISNFGGVAFEYFFTTGGERATFAASASGFHILAITRTDDTGNYVGYYDGTEVFSNAVNTANDWDPRVLDSIGANSNVGTVGVIADIAEIILYHANLGATDLDSVHDYLKNKYGIA